MAQLTGGSKSVTIGPGFEIRAPGIKGEATAFAVAGETSARARAGMRAQGPAALEEALSLTGLTLASEVELNFNRQAPQGADRALRGPGNQEVAELMVPAPPPGHDQVILSIDEQGAMTWHLPATPAPVAPAPGEAQRGRLQQKFLIPTTREVPPIPPGPDAEARRSAFGAVARKLLKVLVYPITDPILGMIGAKFAEMWEAAKRPYGLRSFTPENYKEAQAPALMLDDFKRLAQGRSLLFIHGTFSTAHGAFFGLCENVMGELAKRYHGRVFAFNHYTLSHDPARNVQWFIDQLPRGIRLDMDIVCHSRGGLVARKIAEHAAGTAASSNVTVKRLVLAGVPNAGTLLADKDHMVQMIDRLTTVMNLFPTGPVTEFLEGLITAVKVLGHAGLAGLPGLASMDPRGEFIKQINGAAAVNAVAYAVAADYEPTDAALRSLILSKVADSIVDRIFEQAPNDLVVPQLGVFDKNGGAGFPIPPEQVLKIDKSAGVMHTTLFGHKPTCEKMLEWLTEA